MDRKTMVLILGAYILLLGFTGYLSFFKFPGDEVFPQDQGKVMADNRGDVKLAKSDPDLKKEFLANLESSRAEERKLIDLAAHSFDVLLGALLGFLSATAVSAGIGK